MKEANLLLRVLICSFSWFHTAWMLVSTSRFTGLSRLWFTWTALMVPMLPAPPKPPARFMLVPRPSRELLLTREKAEELMLGPLENERLLKAPGPEVDTLKDLWVIRTDMVEAGVEARRPNQTELQEGAKKLLLSEG